MGTRQSFGLFLQPVTLDLADESVSKMAAATALAMIGLFKYIRFLPFRFSGGSLPFLIDPMPNY
jgi:hypothetical protein